MSRKDISDAQVITACADAHAEGMALAPWCLLMERTGQPEKVVYAAMRRTEQRGLIESGVSLRTGWPTAEGYALIGRQRLPPPIVFPPLAPGQTPFPPAVLRRLMEPWPDP